MPDTVNAVAGSTVRPEWAIPPEESSPTNELGKDEFLQLLVAQLRYQDPLEPQSSDEFIATTAQFTVVEKLDELTKQGANTALINSLTTAGSLVGREITASRDGVSVTAVVDRSTIRDGQVVLETPKGAIALAQIVSIGAAPAPTESQGVEATAIPVVPTAPPARSADEEPDRDEVDATDTQTGNGLA